VDPDDIPDPHDLPERARRRAEQLPAETALGNPDPEGGDMDDPKILDQAAVEEGEQQHER
jgi:hypothetical protein